MGVAVGDIDTLMPHPVSDCQGGEAISISREMCEMPLRYNYTNRKSPVYQGCRFMARFFIFSKPKNRAAK
jgi:hypothetical protein